MKGLRTLTKDRIIGDTSQALTIEKIEQVLTNLFSEIKDSEGVKDFKLPLCNVGDGFFIALLYSTASQDFRAVKNLLNTFAYDNGYRTIYRLDHIIDNIEYHLKCYKEGIPEDEKDSLSFYFDITDENGKVTKLKQSLISNCLLELYRFYMLKYKENLSIAKRPLESFDESNK